MNTLVNILAMQIGWFACVLGAASHMPWVGTSTAVAVATLHLARTTEPLFEIKLMAVALAMGLLLDSALASGGFIAFHNGVLATGLTTHWMLGLWLGFATTLNASLRWLLARPAAAIAFGAIGGPLAYWSGAKLGALTLVIQPDACIAVALAWSLAMGVFALLLNRRRVESSTIGASI